MYNCLCDVCLLLCRTICFVLQTDVSSCAVSDVFSVNRDGAELPVLPTAV